jgi:hypothetical protein
MPWQTAKKSPAYNKAAWRRARNNAMKRANWRCEIRVPGICIGAATQVDHADQLANDPNHENLRAACAPCHKHVTALQGNAARNRAPADPAPLQRTAW